MLRPSLTVASPTALQQLFVVLNTCGLGAGTLAVSAEVGSGVRESGMTRSNYSARSARLANLYGPREGDEGMNGLPWMARWSSAKTLRPRFRQVEI